MGPLIPQGIISGELNFFFAFIIGLAFGFILEQAGFSTSRKLAGVFYGYDFVVLKVFFTAGITAATAMFFMKYLGWIDFNFLYINPLYVWSAIIGGVIMGVGFIMGGFCPGTSFAAAVIGKIDAIVFIAGMFLGIFIFGTFYPTFEPIHLGHFLGNVFIHDTLGIKQSWFLFFLIFMALIAFAVTQKIENNASRFKELLYAEKVNLRWPTFFIIVLALTAVIIPQKRASFVYEPTATALHKEILSSDRYVKYDKAAFSIINKPGDMQFIDVRSREAFENFHLPGAIHIPLHKFTDKNVKVFINELNATPVLYANASPLADKAWFFARRSGIKNVKVLEGGLNHFFDKIFTEHQWEETTDIEVLSYMRFINRARDYFLKDHYESIPSKKEPHELPTPQTREIAGGC